MHKIILFFFLLSFIWGADQSPRKIIVASYPNLSTAKNGLVLFNKLTNQSFKDKQILYSFETKVRESGNSFILVLEPFQSYKAAKDTKKTIPTKFSDAFINRYTIPNNITPNEIIEEKVDTEAFLDLVNEEIILDIPQVIQPKEKITTIEEETQNKITSDIPKAIQTTKVIAPIKEINQSEVTSSSIVPKISTIFKDDQKFKETNKTTFKEPTVTTQLSTNKNSLEKISQFQLPILVILLSISFIAILLLIKLLKNKNNEIYDLTVFNQKKTTNITQLDLKIQQTEALFQNMINLLKSSFLDISQTYEEKKKEKIDDVLIQKFLKLQASVNTYSDLKGEFTLEESEFNLSLLMKKVLDLKKDNTIMLDSDTKLPKTLIGDEKKVSKILFTLCDVFLNDTKDGDFLISLKEIKRNLQQVSILFTIKKSGNSLDKSQINLIQNTFLTQNRYYVPSDEIIDLVIAKRFIEKMGGSIKFNTQLGRGNEFVCILPFDFPEKEEQRKYRLPYKEIMKKSVLIADKNILAIGILRRQLEYFHMNVKPCFSWEQAQDSLNETFLSTDLLIIQADLLPEIDVEQIIDLSKRKNFPIVFIVNSKKSEFYERVSQINEAQMLLKPYTQDTILELLIEIYDKKELTPKLLNTSNTPDISSISLKPF